VKCTAGGFGIAAVLGVIFCLCSFGGERAHGVATSRERLLANEGNNSVVDPHNSGFAFFEDYYVIPEDLNAAINESVSTNQRINKRTGEESPSPIPYLSPAISAIGFQASLAFLDPSLKSVLSIVSSSSDTSMRQSSKLSLGFTMGFMTTIANVGGMIGNIAGTWMYKLSIELFSSGHVLFGDGSLPFFVSAVFLAISSLLIWGLEEHSYDHALLETCEETAVELNNVSTVLEESVSPRDGCCLGLRERETNYELKCD
jgi:hypothetical protein